MNIEIKKYITAIIAPIFSLTAGEQYAEGSVALSFIFPNIYGKSLINFYLYGVQYNDTIFYGVEVEARFPYYHGAALRNHVADGVAVIG